MKGQQYNRVSFLKEYVRISLLKYQVISTKKPEQDI
jgi:hypothetical protein